MPLQITGRHTEVSQQDRDYLEKKVPRIQRLFDRIDEFSVVFIAEKKGFVVEINFRAGQIRAFTKGAGETTKAALDVAIERLHAQLAKAREKKFGNKIHSGETIRAAERPEEEETESA